MSPSVRRYKKYEFSQSSKILSLSQCLRKYTCVFVFQHEVSPGKATVPYASLVDHILICSCAVCVYFNWMYYYVYEYRNWIPLNRKWTTISVSLKFTLDLYSCLILGWNKIFFFKYLRIIC